MSEEKVDPDELGWNNGLSQTPGPLFAEEVETPEYNGAIFDYSPVETEVSDANN